MNVISALLIFTVIVVVHEAGHCLLAKKNGIFVTEFSVGMGPRLISWMKADKKWEIKFLVSAKEFDDAKWAGHTKYSIKLLPLGGSCMMLGEDELLDREDSFNKKGVWARFSAVVAGPVFNFLLAFVLSVILIGCTGTDLPYIAHVYENRPGIEAGLEKGDKIISIEGKKMVLGRDVTMFETFDIAGYDEVDLVIERDGKIKEITMDVNYDACLYGFSYTQSDDEAEISQVNEDLPFMKAGIEAGDIITAIDGTKIHSGNELAAYMNDIKVDENAELEFTYERNGKEIKTMVSPQFYEGKSLGIYVGKYQKLSPIKVIAYSFSEVRYWIVSTIRTLGQLITGKVSTKNLMGAVGIVDMVGGVIESSQPQGLSVVLLSLVNMCILLSANLGVMNLLPIPALDGGRLVFILIEAVRKKPIDQEKEGLVHLIGFALLMLLMVYVMFNDIRRIFHI